MPFYFGHSVWFSFRDGAISFGHLFLGIPFDFSTGMVPFHLVIYFWSYHLIFLQGWCHFILNDHPLIQIQLWLDLSPFFSFSFYLWPSKLFFLEWCHFQFKPVERDILALFLRSILDTVRPFLISSICRICFYFSSFGYWSNGAIGPVFQKNLNSKFCCKV